MLSIMGEKKSVNIFRFAKLQAILFTFPGIVAGILYSFGALEAILFNTIFNRFRIFDLHLD